MLWAQGTGHMFSSASASNKCSLNLILYSKFKASAWPVYQIQCKSLKYYMIIGVKTVGGHLDKITSWPTNHQSRGKVNDLSSPVPSVQSST